MPDSGIVPGRGVELPGRSHRFGTPGHITTYVPEQAIRQGYGNLVKEMVRDLFRTRWLTMLLLKRNFVANYKQSVLGIFWAFIAPLGSVGMFVILNAGGVVDVGDTGVPYPLWALASIALWQMFSGGVTLGLNSLVAAGGMVRKVYFPREVLVFSAVGQAVIPPLIQTVLVLLVFAYVQIMPPATIFLVPLAMIPLFLMTLGLTFILSVFNSMARDVGGVISVVMMVLMFVTPILYAKPPEGIVSMISYYNPFYYLVTVPRNLFLFGGIGQPGNPDPTWGYIYSALLAVAVFLVCWLAFRMAGTRMVERL